MKDLAATMRWLLKDVLTDQEQEKLLAVRDRNASDVQLVKTGWSLEEQNRLDFVLYLQDTGRMEK